MYGSRITISSWNGAKRSDEIIEKPDLEAVESAIRKLDGSRTTDVAIDGECNTCLIIGGGSGRYVGFIARSDEELHNLINPTGSPERQIKLRIGGQTGYYTEQQCVDLKTVVQAAQTFAERGDLDPSVTWEIQK